MSFSRNLLKALAPDSPFVTHQPTLYKTLSRLPQDGVGRRILQTRWESKGFQDTYWEVTRVKLKNDGQNGKAWGKFYWKGKLTSFKGDEPIRGGLKYKWKEFQPTPA